ncbi:hypothetical protein BD311DRAFT_745094 [Dichomitus squalens]|uniref:Uncharacterized protein n=1 Tax=Dichomitus squalens TaxID=114155 RepID=A0A4Q9N7H5_9APHY|nr:hypothetical protein BD311DRAFT_745094 [Dichomitus squalens]
MLSPSGRARLPAGPRPSRGWFAVSERGGRRTHGAPLLLGSQLLFPAPVGMQSLDGMRQLPSGFIFGLTSDTCAASSS